MTTLTDRYVWAVVHRLPSDQREDVDAELRSTIADMAEAQGEHAALVQLGDPGVLVDNYRGHRRALIGAELYPEYVRLLRLLLAIVVPILVALSALAAALEPDPTVGSVVVGVLGGAWTAVVQVAFWLTVVFAAIERFVPPADRPTATDRWSPDDLPELPVAPQVGLGETVTEVVLTLVLVTTLFLQRTWSPVQDASGAPVPLLDPELWSGAMWVIIALLLGTAVVVVLAHLRGSWSWPLAAATTLMDLGLLVLIGWLAAEERLIDPAFLAGLSAELELDSVLQPSPWLITLAIGAVLVWDAVEALRAAARSGPGR